MHISILGAGMVGRTIAADLSTKHTVTSYDLSEANLSQLKKESPLVHTIQVDLLQYGHYMEWLKGSDLVISAVPGFMGYRALESIIEAGHDVVDISFFPEDALPLHDLAVKNKVRAIVDCGVAPGLSNLVLGRCDAIMQVTSFECMVGGLPKARTWPFAYKAPFSPIDVLEEYTRPARYVENSRLVVRPALSDPELIEFDGIGTLESFNTDGLRSIIHTMKHIPNMKEKTLRYPGHISLISALQRAGFFETTERDIRGKLIRPIDVTAAILFDQWKLQPEDDEFTVMSISISGIDNGKKTKRTYSLYDERDQVTGQSSMSRTTGFTCTAAADMLLQGKWTAHGVFPPELIGKDEQVYRFIMDYLSRRGISFTETIE